MSTTLARLAVRVTQEHINEGAIGDCASCPIALALDEVLPVGVCAEVFQSSTVLWAGKRQLGTVAHSDLLTGWIKSYDRGDVVSPFGFTMEVPAEVLS